MSESEHEESTYGLVMPFVTVQSKGGPHEDGAYTAGYAMGLLDAELRCYALHGGADCDRAVRIEDRAQADLVAMKTGFSALFEDSEIDGWLWATFTRTI